MKQDESLVDFLLRRNAEQVKLYRQKSLLRRGYRSDHPTEIAATKCSDGRLNIPVLAEIPPGIIQPFRNIGGFFDLGWPYFHMLVQGWVNYAMTRQPRRLCLFPVTYHWAEGSIHRGCKGNNYDVDLSRKNAIRLITQLDQAFGGEKHEQFYPFLLGIETDSDALIIHGKDDCVIDARSFSGVDQQKIYTAIHEAFPDMQERMLLDLMPLLAGNIRHVEKVRQSNRKLVDVEHREQILVVGRGVHWLHEPNRAVIVGPYSPDLSEPITTAANILLDNLNSNRISDEEKSKGVVIMTSALFRDESGPEYEIAVEKAKWLADFTRQTIRKNVPDLWNMIHELAGITNANSLQFTPIQTNL